MKTANVSAEDIISETDNMKLKEELRSCQHFLVDFELDWAGHKVFNYARENFNAKILDEKLDHFFNKLKCTADMKLGFRFNLKRKIRK